MGLGYGEVRLGCVCYVNAATGVCRLNWRTGGIGDPRGEVGVLDSVRSAGNRTGARVQTQPRRQIAKGDGEVVGLYSAVGVQGRGVGSVLSRGTRRAVDRQRRWRENSRIDHLIERNRRSGSNRKLQLHGQARPGIQRTRPQEINVGRAVKCSGSVEQRYSRG